MAEIKDCIGKEIKISKCSITIKSKEGKTCGVVRDTRKFKDIQPNKASEYFHLLKKCGAWGNRNFNIDNCIEKDGKLYAFRNMKSKMFHEKYGYCTDEEGKYTEETNTENQLRDIKESLICLSVEILPDDFPNKKLLKDVIEYKGRYSYKMSDGELGETQRANYFSRLYLIDCAVPFVNIYSCRKCGTLQTAGLSA